MSTGGIGGRLRGSAFRAIAGHRNTRTARFAARLSGSYLNAFGNLTFNPRINGEHWVVSGLPAGTLGTVFDVGANKGDYARMILDAHPAANVHCFEVAPAIAEELRELMANDTQVLVNPFGLGSSDGTATLHLNQQDSKVSSLVLGLDRSNTSVAVEIRTGDAYCREHEIPTIDLLKIDTEGFDLEVLRGFSNLLDEKQIALIQFEYSGWNIFSRALLLDFYELLTPLGFRIGKLRPRGVEFKPYSTIDEDFRGPNCIAVLESRTDLIEALRGEYLCD